MAKSFKIIVTAKSPLNVGSRKPYGHFLETLDYIPGSVMRGAFAKFLMKEERKLFESLFASQDNVISFSNLYPTSRLEGTGIPHILPMTAVSCKYEKGFCTGYDEIGEDIDKPPHGVFDTLIHELIFDQFGNKLPFAFQPRCPKCGARVEPISGYYDSPKRLEDRTSAYCKTVDNEYYPLKFSCLKEDCPRSYKKAESKTQRTTKTALNRLREVSQEEMLYSVEAISQEQSFVGIITLSDNSLSEQVEEKLRKAEKIRIGGSASRGFGRVDIQVNDFDELDSPEKIKKRIDNFNAKIQEVAEFYQFFASESIRFKDVYFTIDFQSDAILFDKFLRNTAKISGEDLKDILEVDLKIELVSYYSRMSERSGWSFAWKLPKEKEQVLEKGSVFLFRCSDIDKLYEPLCELQKNGIGEKCEEGLGRITICNPFHEEVYCS